MENIVNIYEENYSIHYTLDVIGNTIYENKNKKIIYGVSKSGLEYLYVDYNRYIEEFISKDLETMYEWGFNCIRIPLRNSHWKFSNYQKIVNLYIYYAMKYRFIILLDLHTLHQSYGLDTFMIRNSNDLDPKEFWKNISITYEPFKNIIYEIFNEPHNISPTVWWNGNDLYYGYKEIIDEIKKYSNQLLIINGLDYGYQLHFIQQNQTLFHELKSYSNIIIGSHPYAYKGFPSFDPSQTMAIQTQKYNTTLCKSGYTLPLDNNYSNGWYQSFGYLHIQNHFPILLTEFGLDTYDSSLQGGWYIQELLNYSNTYQIGWIAWAWVADRLDYPSLINEKLLPTGKPTIGRELPCSVKENQFYQGPGVTIYNHLKLIHSHSSRKLFDSYHISLFYDLFYLFIFIIIIKMIHTLYRIFYKKLYKIPSLQNMMERIHSFKSFDV
jgi:aryl-phospho-beta-D-glucosidase BglC (GH1 family)